MFRRGSEGVITENYTTLACIESGKRHAFPESQKTAIIRWLNFTGAIPGTRETAMRMMLRFTLPVEKSNAAINDGSLGRTMESILSKLKPEAAYFAPLDGKRAGMIFFDMAEPSQIIEAVEPLFLSLNATTELVPVMNADDLRKGLSKVAGK
jgi:hypothetical protein